MSELRLATNLVKSTNYGHLQIVLVQNDGSQYENEIQAPPLFTIPINGKWKYLPLTEKGKSILDHNNTPYYTTNSSDDSKYTYTTLDLNNRSAEGVWNILSQVNEQFSTKGKKIDYDIKQNSNSYINTILSVVGIEAEDYQNKVTPTEVKDFPGIETNVLYDTYKKTAISLKLDGTGDNDIIHTGIKNDTVHGFGGNDTIFGEAGNDKLYGEDGKDLIFGGKGKDTIYGDNGNDDLRGEDGKDKLFGGFNDDNLYGGNDKDDLRGEDGNDLLRGEDGDDTLYGGNHIDTLYGDSGNDLLKGEDGDDTLYGGLGKDQLFGDSGDDTLKGEDNRDLLNGGLGDDALFGGKDNDFLNGEQGSDTLNGGLGKDVLSGGLDEDIFVFDGEFNNDTVVDFEPSLLGSGDTLNVLEATEIEIQTAIDNAIQKRAGAHVSFENGSILLVGIDTKDLNLGMFGFFTEPPVPV